MNNFEKKPEAFTSIRRVSGRKYEDISEKERQETARYMEGIFKDQEKFKKNLLRDFGNIENIPELLRTVFFCKRKNARRVGNNQYC